MNAVKTVSVHVVGEAAGATDTTDKNKFLFRNTQGGKDPLNVGENRVIPAAGASADVVAGVEVFLGELDGFALFGPFHDELLTKTTFSERTFLAWRAVLR